MLPDLCSLSTLCENGFQSIGHRFKRIDIRALLLLLLYTYSCLIEEATIFLTYINPINLPKALPIFSMTSSSHKGKDKLGTVTQKNMEDGFNYGNQVAKKNQPHPKSRTLLPSLSSYLQLHCNELWKSLKHEILPINLLSNCHLTSSWKHHSFANIYKKKQIKASYLKALMLLQTYFDDTFWT